MTHSRTLRVAADVGVAGVRRWGEGPPEVVLCHGAGGNRDSLAPLGDLLAAQGLDVAAIALPGRTGSEGPPAETIEQAAAWLASVLAALAPQGTVLLGHSMGGGVAIETTMGTDARVRGVVLAATGARLRVHPDILARAAETVQQGGHLAELAAAPLRPDGPPTARSHVLTAEAMTPGESALADWRSTDQFDRLSDIEGLDLPVLAIAGELDRLTPVRYAEFIVEHAPSAEMVVLPGAGHWLPVEEAEQVADVVAAFVRRVRA